MWVVLLTLWKSMLLEIHLVIEYYLE